MKKPKVLVDARMVAKLPGGIGRYATGIAESLGSRKLPYDLEFLIDAKHEAEVKSRFAPFPTLSTDISFLSLREVLRLKPLIAQAQPALFHNVSFAAVGVPEGIPYCMTLHDLNHMHYGNVFQQFYYQFFTRPRALGAKKLLTVSKFARKEISFWLEKRESEIEIIHAPCSAENFAQSGVHRAEPVRDYFLLISNPKAFKNTDLIFDVYERYRKQVKHPLSLITNVKPSHGRLLEGVKVVNPNDEELASLMHGARAFLFPSFYEGYGMGFREALCMGTPAIVSDIPPHHEDFPDTEPSWLRYLNPNAEGPWLKALIAFHEGGFETVPLEISANLRELLGLKTFGDRMDRVYRTVLGLPL